MRFGESRAVTAILQGAFYIERAGERGLEMRSNEAARRERFFRMTERHIGGAVDAGVCRISVHDDALDGASITIDGRQLVNFGSCAYLGLNVDDRLKQGAIEAVERFGPVFSSSTVYTSVDLYDQLQDRLESIFGGHVVMPTTTTLAHLSALPVLVGVDDAVIVDAQAHASVHMALQLLENDGVPIHVVPHNDVEALEASVGEHSPDFEKVWYLADGVYSMWGDVAPVEEVADLMERYENLHVYYDDAHGVGWAGEHGRGYVLERVRLHARMVVAVSLAKSFGSGGAALVFPDAATAHRVKVCGGTMTFSGPIHPAELGAAVAAADIHLGLEHPGRQADLLERIDLTGKLLASLQLPVPVFDRTPIWFVKVGGFRAALALTQRLMDEGFFVNIAAFPAVQIGEAGIRFTNTLYHDGDQIRDLVGAIARLLPEVTSTDAIAIDLRMTDAGSSGNGEMTTQGP